MTEGRRLFLRNSGYAVLGHAITTLIALAYAVMLARVLGKDSYGVLAFGMAWYLTFIALSYLGIDVLLARGIGRDHAAAPRLAGSTLVLRLAAAIVIAVAAVLAGVLVPTDSTTRWLVAVLGVALVSRSVWLWCQGVFTAFEDTRKGLLIDLGCRPFEFLLGSTVLLLGGRSVIAIGVVHALAWTVQAVIGVVVVILRVTHLSVRSALIDLKGMLSTGWSAALYSLAVIWFLQAPIVLFSAVGDKDDRGPFALTVQIIGYLIVIPYLAGAVGLPLLSRSAARRDGQTTVAIRAVLVCAPLAGAAFALLAWPLTPPIVELVFGAQYSSAGDMLRVAVWLLIPMTVAIAMQQIIFADEQPSRLSIAPALFGVVVMAAAFVPLTRQAGYVGAFTASGLGLIVWSAGALFFARQAGLRQSTGLTLS